MEEKVLLLIGIVGVYYTSGIALYLLMHWLDPRFFDMDTKMFWTVVNLWVIAIPFYLFQFFLDLLDYVLTKIIKNNN